MAGQDELQRKRQEKELEREREAMKKDLEKKKLKARSEGRIWGKKDLMAEVDSVTEEYFERIDAFIPMRYLDEGVAADLQDYQTAGTKMIGDPENREKMQMEIDVPVSAAGERLARQMAVAYVLSVNGEQWDVEDVKKLNPGLVTDIATRAFEIAGLTEESQEAIKSIRDERGGGESSVSGDERSSNGSLDAEVNTSTELVSADSGSESEGKGAGS